jgi:hypothetical protein
VVLGPGDGATVTVTGRLMCADDHAAIPPQIAVVVEWTFVRTPGVLPRSVRSREATTRTATVAVSLKDA